MDIKLHEVEYNNESFELQELHDLKEELKRPVQVELDNHTS